MDDWGYDVSNHCAVDPLFGNNGIAERMIEEAHRRGIKVMVDYIANHTSIRHPWFVESASSSDNPKRDWYVWRDPKEDGSPPNNWVSVFSGPAWTLDHASGQYYRHTYLPHQPDLNWRNPELREVMYDVARFWLDRGVDGLRIDAAHQMMKDPAERDNPPVPEGYERPWKDMGEYDNFVHLYDLAHPDVHEVHRELRAVLDEYDGDRVAVGEIHIFDAQEWASYYGENFDELHMPFNFHLFAAKWDAASTRAAVETVLFHLPERGWTNWTLGNHDEIRMVTRLGEENARIAAMLLLTLRGSPFLYYGDEIGMEEATLSAAEHRDPWGDKVEYLSRDGCRTPMQWDATPDAGFGSDSPWLPLSSGHEIHNVREELQQPGSMLNLYRRLLSYRKDSESLKGGSYTTHPASDESVYVFERGAGKESVIVAVNFTDQPCEVALGSGTVVLSTSVVEPRLVDTNLRLGPKEGVIFEPAGT
jgi:glycosidase